MRKGSRPLTSSRTKDGVQLVELLAALLIAGILAGVLGSSLSEVIRLNTASDRSLLACIAAQEIIERIRSTPLDTLPPPGVYNVQINLGGSSELVSSPAGGNLTQRPLMLDGTKLVWAASQTDGELPKSKFVGNAQLEIEDLGIADTKRIIVKITWTDSTVKGLRKYETGTVVTSRGISRHI